MVGETLCESFFEPSLTSVVEQMFWAIMIEGYMDLKSSTATQGWIPGSTSWT